MTKESKPLIVSMIINFISSSIKVIVGLFCQSKSMIADGFYSLSDFMTDIIAFIGSKISNKRANKKYPIGFGRIQYIIDIFIATIIFIIGLYTIFNSITKQATTINILWVIAIIFTIILKLINSKYLMSKGLQYNSPLLITSSKETEDDMTTSLGVIIIIILSQFSTKVPFLRYVDPIGGVILGLLIIRTSIGLYKDNILYLLGQVENNREIEDKVKNILNEYSEVEYKSMELVKHGSYYSLELEVYILQNIRVYKLLTIESDIRNKIKKLRYRIKFIDININHKYESKI